MCGICGYVGPEEDRLIERMTESIRHRGPDAFGYYRQETVSFGHRRLSIIDLAGGSQPMSSDDGLTTIVFNGEIYNYLELRAWLEKRGTHLNTNSDTEVLLKLFERCGADALPMLNGMFAFAIHDRRQNELFLARDRIGIKPLYYAELGDRFLFASEMKALLAYEAFEPTINPSAIDDYLALRYVPGRRTMFNEVRRLPAGHYLVYKRNKSTIQPYWIPPRFGGPYLHSEAEYLDEFGALMERSVRRRLISDVPFGAYLSGGLDSSVIVGLMSQFVSEPVKTFSVGFDYEHDELAAAAITARLLGCEHQEVACRANDVMMLPDIVYHMDEPQGDPISIPMYMLSREAKKKVTVILTGEGGDEIFGGYLFHKMMWMGDLYRRALPRAVRNRVVMPLMARIPASFLNVAFQYPAYLGERGKQKVLDYLNLMEPEQIDLAYRHLISLYDERDVQELYTYTYRAQLEAAVNSNKDGNNKVSWDGSNVDDPYLNRLLHLQFDHWLPDNMLLRQDKTGMAHGIEGRVPFLDHELIEFALRLPPHLKLHNLTGKYILRRYAQTILPNQITRRKKMPFYVPIETYFRQPDFQEMMHDLLSEESVRSRGLFRPQAVATLRQAMQEREFLLVKQVFSLMVLELWFRIYVDRTRH